jgi:hypothetical protein
MRIKRHLAAYSIKTRENVNIKGKPGKVNDKKC